MSLNKFLWKKNSPEPNMWLLVNHTKPKDTVLKLIYFNSVLLSTSGQLQNSGQLENNSVNGAMLITMNRVINNVYLAITILYKQQWQLQCYISNNDIKIKKTEELITLLPFPTSIKVFYKHWKIKDWNYLSLVY